MAKTEEFELTLLDLYLKEDGRENYCGSICEEIDDDKGEGNDGIVMFDGLNLVSVLSKLRDDKYLLDSIGLGNTWSIVNSVTVCGFKGLDGFCYLAFYYDTEVGAFVTKVILSKERMYELIVNEKNVVMNRVSKNIGEEVSTLIRGFDIVNFREYNLV